MCSTAQIRLASWDKVRARTLQPPNREFAVSARPACPRIVIALWLTAFAGSGCWLVDRGEASPDASLGVACSVATDCPESLVCAGGACQPEGATGLGGPCWANRDCQPDLQCSAQGFCGPAGTGSEGERCGTGGECRDDLRCELDGLSGTCVPGGDADVGGACSVNTDCIPGLVCGPDGQCAHPSVAYPPFEGVACAEDDGPFRVHFEVPPSSAAEFFRLPFPSDARVRGDGTLDLDDFPRPGPQALGIDFVSMYADALSEDFRGFSTTGVVTMRLSGGLDPDTATGDAVHLVDITEGSSEYGQPRARLWSYTSARNLYRCGHALVIRPQPFEPLRGGHTYAAYVTTALRSTGGEPATADEDLQAMLAASPPEEAERLRAWEVHAPLRAYLASAEIDPGSIAGAAVFTVQDAIAPARALAAAVEDGALPVVSDVTVCDEGVTSPCEDEIRGCAAPSSAFVEIHGRFRVPIFQEGTPPYERPSDGGAIAFDGAGAPIPQGHDDVCFALTVPRGEDAPEGGWPVVVYAHGTGGNFTSGVREGVAAALAGAPSPMAMLAYEGVVHGERRGDSTRDPDALMFNIGNPRAARDNHLQGAVDVLQALRLAEVTIAAGEVGDVELDPSGAYVFGHSQGSNVGIPALAVTQLTEAAVLSGAGAYLSEALLSKTSPVDSRRGLERLVGDELSVTHPVMVLWQTFFDPVDTLTFAPLLVSGPPEGLPSKHVLMTWGPADTFSPQPTLEMMARAAGLPVVEPAIEDLDSGLVSRPVEGNRRGGDGEDRMAACVQYATEGYDGHFVATRNPAAVADWVQFFTTAQTGVPRLDGP
jgi:predicted esterase